MSPPPDAARDLLFGLIAHLNGLIDSTALAAAIEGGPKAGDEPLGDRLVACGTIGYSLKTAIETIAECQVSRNGGDVERALGSLSTSPSNRESPAYPRNLTLGSTFPYAKGSDESVATEMNETIVVGRTSFEVGTSTSQGQRFRVLRPHKKGGLGAVFVALDTELNREVALKQIQEQYADDVNSRARFVLEAEVTGGLEHPGIVPVYGLGTDDLGRPYYAMRFIRGQNLKDAIASFHTKDAWIGRPGDRAIELRKLLRKLLDVCNAIEYAHRRKVLHRDLKPGNIMVGRYGETLVVDWGLAKTAASQTMPQGLVAEPIERPLIPSASSGSAHTLPGSEIGTPAYMSPEQASGKLDEIGPASDVYSLGATLYTLLTGRPAFIEGDRKRLLEMVRRGEFPHPRSIDSTIDPAMEFICLKAMAPRPQDRHQSPIALAEDVERWLADEPVLGHREGSARKLMRWARRHRAWTQAVAASALVVTVVSMATTVVIKQAYERERTALVREENSRRLAQKNFNDANNVIRELLFKPARGETGIVNKAAPLRQRLANEAARLSDSFLANQPENRDVRKATADIHQEAGNIARMIGQYDVARPHYLRAIELSEGLLNELPDDPRSRLSLFSVYNDAAEWDKLAGKAQDSLRYYRSAEALARDMLTRSATDANSKKALATVLGDLGNTLHDLGQATEAEAVSLESVTMWDAMANDPGANYDDEKRWVNTIALRDRASIRIDAGKLDEALSLLARAERVLVGISKQRIDNNNTRFLRASTRSLIARVHARQGSYELAETEFGAILPGIWRLVTELPDTVVYPLELAKALDGRGYARFKLMGKWNPPAESDSRQGLSTLEPLVQRLRDNHRFQLIMIGILDHLAEVTNERGSLDESTKLTREAGEWRARVKVVGP